MGRLADRMKARARLKRLMYPIRSYVGPNGTGKSACMVYDALANMERGRPQLSTVRLLDYKNPRPCEGGALCDDPASHQREAMATSLRPFDPDDDSSPLVRHLEPTGNYVVHRQAHPLYVPFRTYQQLLSWTDGDVLMDEITGIASSRESSNMPPQISNMLVQLRRRNVSLSWSTPSWGRADKVIREVTQLVTLMTASLPTRSAPTPDGLPRLWHQRRLFCARSYDPSAVDEFEAHRAMSEEVHPDLIAFYWGPGSTMFKAYDTLDAVSSLGWANDAGMCMGCGGKRRIPSCSCDDHRGSPVGVPSRPALVPVGAGARQAERSATVPR
jgi:hypothetical protein